MPELPEVEATRRLLIRHARGHRVVSITGGDDDKIFEGAGADAVRGAFVGRSIADGHRLGKQFWLTFDDGSKGPTSVMHLGMTGQVWVRTPEGGLDAVSYVRDVGNGNTATNDDQQQQWPPRFCKLELELSSGARIALCDARRFGRVRLIPAGVDPLTRPPLSALGFDPLLSMPPLDAFATLLARRRSAKLKALLLDQSFSAGVGNWVADDVLWQARLHPEQKAGDLLDDEEDGGGGVARLHAAIRGVCERACSVDADSSRFPETWLFHHRWTGGKATRLPTGERVEFITAGGRTTAYVPAVQRMIKAKAGGGGGGGAGAGGGGGKKKKKPQKEEEDDEAAAAAAAAETGGGKTKKKKKRAKEEEDEDDDGEGRGQKVRLSHDAPAPRLVPPLPPPPPPRQRQPRSRQSPLNNDDSSSSRRGPRGAPLPPPAASRGSVIAALSSSSSSSIPRPLLRGGGGARGAAARLAAAAAAAAARLLRR
jgi:formamidopyrimidine-DNA glycosylase